MAEEFAIVSGKVGKIRIGLVCLFGLYPQNSGKPLKVLRQGWAIMQVVFCITHSSCRAESESEVAMMDDKKTCEDYGRSWLGQ